MVRRSGIRLLTAAFLLTAVSTQVAAAATPPNSARTFKKMGFESTSDSPQLNAIPMPGEPATVAFWGRVSGGQRSGSYALWCAGTAFPSLAPSVYWTARPMYPQYTRGTADVAVPQTADMYRSWVEFYFTCPTKGKRDWFTLVVTAPDAEVTDRRTYFLPDTGFVGTGPSAWTKKSYELSRSGGGNLSRRAGTLTILFHDTQEGAGEGALTGRGPLIDDLALKGYRYGPPRSLKVSASRTSVKLSWTKPAVSTVSTEADPRSLTYRVWRRVSGSSKWTELTKSRATKTSYTDKKIKRGTTYEYHVQAWDTGKGSWYGQSVRKKVKVPR